MRGLSTVVSILIFLIIIITIAIPLYTVFSYKPTAQEQQILNIQPYKLSAEQQYVDFEDVVPTAQGTAEPPISFIYTENGTVFFVFNVNETPPEPLIIEYLLVFNGTNWVQLGIVKQGNSKYIAEETQNTSPLLVSPSDTNSEYYGNPAIAIQLSVLPYSNSTSYIVAVTQYGDVVYAIAETEY